MQQAAALDSVNQGCSNSIWQLKVALRILEITHDLTGQHRCHVFNDKAQEFLRFAGLYVRCSGGLHSRQEQRGFPIFPPRGVQNGEVCGIHLHSNFNWNRVMS